MGTGTLLIVFLAGISVLILPVSVLVTIGFLPFSKRVRERVKKYPLLHALWFVIAVVVFYFVFIATGSD